MKKNNTCLAAIILLSSLTAAGAEAATPALNLSYSPVDWLAETPPPQAWQTQRESFAFEDRLCPEGICAPYRSTLAPAAEDGSGGRDIQGPSDTTGYYLLAAIPVIVGAGSLLGVDHRLAYDNSGIWKRSKQLDLEYGVILTEVGGALWEGGDNRLGRTYWQAIDSTLFSALAVQGLKYATGRERPSQSDSPNHWLKGGSQSFPSGEVTLQASFVTPFIAEYSQDHPWVWALEALPVYDGVARMKTWGHWQTDVLSGWALGTAFGIFAHNRDMPFFLSYMPHGVMVGWHSTF